MTAAGLRDVKLGPDRLAGALALSAEAGWNQIEPDWRFMFANGNAFGLVDERDALVGSGLTVEFPDYAWISMILVTAPWRRRGLATHLMDRCIATLAERRLVPALDASPEGRQVYLRLGFRDVETSTRLVGPAANSRITHPHIEPLSPAVLPEVANYDRQISSTDRATLLAHLFDRCPEAAFVSQRGGRMTGYVLARRGRLSSQIGPLSADDPETAAALLDQARAALEGPICLDLLDRHDGMRSALAAGGFAPVTHFVRMVLGNAFAVPVSPRAFILGGPEFS